MDRADRRQESERLRTVLIHVRDKLDDLIGHLDEDVLPPRMVAASAHHLMSAAMANTVFEKETEAFDDPKRRRKLGI